MGQYYLGRQTDRQTWVKNKITYAVGRLVAELGAAQGRLRPQQGTVSAVHADAVVWLKIPLAYLGEDDGLAAEEGKGRESEGREAHFCL